MIYKRLAACLLVACLSASTIATDALAWQTEEAQVSSQAQADGEKSEPAAEAVSDKTAPAPVPEKAEEPAAAPKPEKEAMPAPEPEKTVDEPVATPVPEQEPASEENTAAPKVEKPQEEAEEDAERSADAGSAEAPTVSPSAKPEVESAPDPAESPEAGEDAPEGDIMMTEPAENPDSDGSSVPESEKTTPELPEDETAKPENAPELPEDETAKPENTPELPGDETSQPENTPELPGDETPQPENTPEPDSTDAPEETSSVRLKAKADRLHAFVDRDTVKVEASISGGTAPYEVSFRAKGAASEKKTVALESEDTCTFKCRPDAFGTIEITVKVTDAAGETATEKIEVAAPVRITEDPKDWEKDFEDLELTGDWRVDLIAIALTQLGYEESSRNFVIEEDGSRKGYTRYGDWYSYSSDYYDWCAMFICFCLHYADISRSDYPWDNISHDWKKNLENRGAFEPAGEYEPGSGDLIFFNKDEDPRIDHIGIVEFVDGETVHTIEGNAGKAVKRRSYALDDETIAGYGNTGYLMEKAGVETEEAEKKIKQNLRQRYDGYTAGTMVNIRAEASAESAWIACIPEKDTRVEVLNVSFSGEQMWYQIRYEDYEGYILGSLLKVDGYTELVYAATNKKSE